MLDLLGNFIATEFLFVTRNYPNLVARYSQPKLLAASTMRLLTLLPWAIALVSYPSPSFSRAVVLPDTNLVSLPITVSIPDAILNGTVATKTRDQPTAHDQLGDSPRFNRRAVIAPQQDKDIKDSDWDTAVAKGCKLNAAMLANDKEAAAMLGLTGDTAESTWKNYGKLCHDSSTHSAYVKRSLATC